MLRSQADMQKLSEPFGTQSTSDFSFKKKKKKNIHGVQMKVILTLYSKITC